MRGGFRLGKIIKIGRALLFKSTSENSTSGLRLKQHMAVCSGATGTPAHSSVARLNDELDDG